MNAILSSNYYVHFSNNYLKLIEKVIDNSNITKCFVLVDENTEKYCLPLFIKNIEDKVKFECLVVKSGEENKNISSCITIWEQLTNLGADRKSLLINLGGGVITDMGGFTASTFKRGIRFVNIPTTLLSMVDASVGGKTGVDLSVLKNQIGLFANPEFVIIDPAFLKTLSKRELFSGLAEIIKYAFTVDLKLWSQIKNLENFEDGEIVKLIYRSVEIKNEIVLTDPKENNLRKILNFGHTLGHAIESYFIDNQSKKNLTHGEAIIIGMVMELYLSHKKFDLSIKKVKEIKEILFEKYPKPEITKIDFENLKKYLKHDKKNTDGRVNFVLLKDFEKCEINCEVSEDLLNEAYQFYSV
ncbi:MAG: 3-dehydroquinate synthase [Lutibacter sp.]